MRKTSQTENICQTEQLEEQLTSQHELLQAIIDNIPVMITVYNPNLKTFSVNREFRRVLGWTEADAADGNLMAKTYPDPDYRRMIEEYMQSLEPGWRDLKVTARNGSVVESSWANIRLSDATAVGIGIDITERKRAEEALQESEERFRTFMDNSSVLAWAKDEEGYYVYLNKTAKRVFGVRLEDWHGKTDFDLWPLELAKIYRENDLTVLETGRTVETVEETIDQEGRHRFWLNSKFLFQDASGRRYVGGVGVDITERRTAEEALRENEEQFRQVFARAPVGMVLMELSGRFIHVNDTYSQITGYSADELIYGGFTFQSLTHPEDLDYNLNEYNRLLSGEIPAFFIEKRYIRKNGTTVWVRASASLRRNEDGRPYQVVGLVEDITERKRAEEALLESEEKFRAVFEQAAVGMGRVNFHNARWIDVNNAFCQMLGYSIEEFKATPWPQITHPDDVDLDLIPFKQMAAGQIDSYSVEKRFYHKQGYYVWARLTLSLVRDVQGQPDYEIAIIENINERKRVEEELHKAREEAERRAEEAEEGKRILEAIMEYIPEGLTIADTPDVSIRMVSKHGQRLLERPGNEIEGIPIEDHVAAWDIYCPDGETRPTGEQLPLSRAAMTGEVVTNEEWVLKTGSGKKLAISTDSGPIRDEEGNITGAIIAWRDISDRKQIEHQKEELLERERHIADVLQKALVPEAPYEPDCCSTGVRYEAAFREADIGGDFYDIFDMGDCKVGVLIGDVAGKGLDAAIRVSAARHAIRSYAYIDPRPGRVMSLANDALCKEAGGDVGMLTAFFAVINTRLGTIAYANGGHETPLVRSADGSVTELGASGQALGVMGGFDYPEESRRLSVGDTIVMVTDGITEARQSATNLFSIEGVKQYIAESDRATASPDEIADGLLEAAKSHAGGKLRDDAAIVVMRWNNSTDGCA